MQFYTKQHQTDCGIDLHARTMYVCILNQAGDILVHQNMKTRPDALLRTIAPYRDDLVIAVECMFTWYWLADLCAQEGIPFVLGHALYMKAIHGGKAQNDTIDAHKIAVLLRGGMLPQAYVYPAAMRATRDLLRRRMYLTRQRAELLTHLPHTNSQDHLPESGKKLADTAHRAGVAERFPALAVHQRLEGDLALRGPEDPRRRERALPLVPAARPPDPNTRSRLQTVPGSGPRLPLGRRYERHDLPRFPRVPAVVASCRRGTGAKESAGTRAGTAGAKRGQASRTGACSEAAVRLRRAQPAGQKALPRREKTQGPGTALTLRAPQRGRAV